MWSSVGGVDGGWHTLQRSDCQGIQKPNWGESFVYSGKDCPEGH